MKYVGGKHMIGKAISQQLQTLCPPDMCLGYVEPFCGSLGVMKYMTDAGYKSYEAYDKHSDLIDMWKAVRDETIVLPDVCTESDYGLWKDSSFECIPERTAIGYGMSFGGIWWGGYARDTTGRRDYMQELKNGFTRILPKIKNVKFQASNYQDLDIQEKLVYLDPPYQGTKEYSAVGHFDHNQFWSWAEKLSDNNTVVVSHPTAPEGWIQVWASEKWRNLQRHSLTRKYETERLFIYAPIFDF
tara:strand:- start:1613 stop:2341 length:729 start_codon:yes stop_codon:yes gene_type:complete